jgi:hypothetical protein
MITITVFTLADSFIPIMSIMVKIIVIRNAGTLKYAPGTVWKAPVVSLKANGACVHELPNSTPNVSEKK